MSRWFVAPPASATTAAVRFVRHAVIALGLSTVACTDGAPPQDTQCVADCDSESDVDTQPDTDTQADTDVCEPDCDGLSCGPDGCGSTCGTCSPGEVCTNGLCGDASNAAPVIVSLGTNVTRLTQGQDVDINVIVTDPDGIDDVIGGELTDPQSGNVYGTFATTASEGAYALTVSWDQLHRVRSIDFEAETERELTVRFFDQSGSETTEQLPLSLHCDGIGACAGTCTDLSTTADCGTCNNTCGPDDVCDAGMCSCPEPLDDCGGLCFDLQTDSNHCGSCDQACRADQVCDQGGCACDGIDFECGGVCTANDESNCGTCGVTCGPLQQCDGTACGCPLDALVNTPGRTEDVDLSVETLIVEDARTLETGWLGEPDRFDNALWRRYWQVTTNPGSTIRIGITGGASFNTRRVMHATLVDGDCNPVQTVSTTSDDWQAIDVPIDDSGPYYVIAEMQNHDVRDNWEYSLFIQQLPIERGDGFDYCDDGRDNDLDGLTDCDDPDCDCPCYPNADTLMTPTDVPSTTATGRLESTDATDGPVPGAYYDAYRISLPANRQYQVDMTGIFADLYVFNANTCAQVQPEFDFSNRILLARTGTFGADYFVIATTDRPVTSLNYQITLTDGWQ